MGDLAVMIGPLKYGCNMGKYSSEKSETTMVYMMEDHESRIGASRSQPVDRWEYSYVKNGDNDIKYHHLPSRNFSQKRYGKSTMKIDHWVSQLVFHVYHSLNYCFDSENHTESPFFRGKSVYVCCQEDISNQTFCVIFQMNRRAIDIQQQVGWNVDILLRSKIEGTSKHGGKRNTVTRMFHWKRLKMWACDLLPIAKNIEQK